MLKRLWIALSIGWAALMVVGMWSQREQSVENWLFTFVVAFAPFAAIPLARWIWAGRNRNA